MTVYIGIDWSEKYHAVCMMNASGVVMQQFTIPHSMDGLVKLDQAIRTQGLKPEEVVLGIETAHTLVIDFCLDYGYRQLYILPPSQVHANQGRYAQSGAKDDLRDAWLMADMLRTDRGRYRPWQPDQPLTRQIQVQVRYAIYLTRMIRRQSNRLRALLLRYYPVAVSLFSRLDSLISLAFVQAYPIPQQAAQLSPDAFQAFLRQHHYSRPAYWLAMYERLHSPQLEAHPDTVGLYQQQVAEIAAHLAVFVRQKQQVRQHLRHLFGQHPDAALFASLPGVADFLAPALLAELGDDRGRFPSAQVVQAMAGTCPITERSGKHRVIRFRRACDRQFRYIATLWAAHALKKSPWAQAYYTLLLKRGLSHTDATRRLANRFLAILWKLWQTHTLYDESFHLQQRQARAKPHA